MYKLPMVGKTLVHLKKRKKAHSTGGKKHKFKRNYFEEQRQIRYPIKKGHIENNSGFGTPVTELYRKVTERRVPGSLLGCETQTVEDLSDCSSLIRVSIFHVVWKNLILHSSTPLPSVRTLCNATSHQSPRPHLFHQNSMVTIQQLLCLNDRYFYLMAAKCKSSDSVTYWPLEGESGHIRLEKK